MHSRAIVCDPAVRALAEITGPLSYAERDSASSGLWDSFGTVLAVATKSLALRKRQTPDQGRARRELSLSGSHENGSK